MQKDIEFISSIIASHGFSKDIPDSSQVLKAWNNLEEYLKEKYGETYNKCGYYNTVNILNEIINQACSNKFLEKSLNELSVSISKHGVLQPILVRKKDDKYEIVAGERRFRAAKLAGLKEVPVIFKDLEEDDAYEIAVIENIQRENLNPIEEANAYKKLMTIGKITQNELAEKIGKDRATIANLIRVLELPSDVQDLIKTKEISLGHAKVLLSLKKIEAQKSFAKKIVSEGLYVRELERLVSDVWILDAGKAHKDLVTSERKILNNKMKYIILYIR